MRATGDILFVSRSEQKFFTNPTKIISTSKTSEIQNCLQNIAAGVEEGLYAAGFIAYEAAKAFDSAFKTHEPTDVPLLWFGLYRDMADFSLEKAKTGEFEIGSWTALVSDLEYRNNIEKIRHFIKDGETYQVNYTFPMQSSFRGDSSSWFAQLCAAQQANYAAFLNIGRYHILSASPELLFRLENKKLEACPMKGTRPRGRWTDEDKNIAAKLGSNEKDRAENIMIVDLLRNDMGRISEPGSVKVKNLYRVEQYPTVWQMTSTIVSQTSAAVPEIIEALFPCGSVTGAPKIRTMEIIKEIEPHPRGIYCGSIGWWMPNRKAEFNVAIRTVIVDNQKGIAHYHVGGGITSGSSPEDEYQECLTKAELLTRSKFNHKLLESILFKGEYFLLKEHMRRLKDSALYFGFSIDQAAIILALKKKGEELSASDTNEATSYKIRLILEANGSFAIESKTIEQIKKMRLGFAKQPVLSDDVFLYHKTTRRAVYEEARTTRPDCDDVLLWNRDGEITESSIANVVLKINNEHLTPPLRSGLLPGVFRQVLLKRGEIRECVLTKKDIARADSIHLINSVRKWMNVEWVQSSSS